MWSDLPENKKTEYKKMMLAFASLSEMFAQKAEEDSEKVIKPILNSKYQETMFKKVFNASQEDVGNTSYDASLRIKPTTGNEKKYLIGIKTFNYGSSSQKVAQFKTNLPEWSGIISQIRKNAQKENGSPKTKKEINSLNNALYLDFAKKIAELRNKRIDSSEANLHGFSVSFDRNNVEAVYHVLMPAVERNNPLIFVGETSYDKIDIDNISICGCTKKDTPANFSFSDGKHKYRFTSADYQLYMDFNTKKIKLETWEVKYAEDAYGIFKEISDRIYGSKGKNAPEIIESYSWKIAPENDIELFSGFNSFYGVGSKRDKESRKRAISGFIEKYKDSVLPDNLVKLEKDLQSFILEISTNDDERKAKAELRDRIMLYANDIDSEGFKRDLAKLVYRPSTEMYIPIPFSKKFHFNHRNFFCADLGVFEETNNKVKFSLNKNKQARQFNLIFEPSGDVLPAFITQDDGKAIESVEKQTFLGDWILKGIFQLKEYEPLTTKKMQEVGINGIRLYKTKKSNDVHIEFIWIDDDNLPDDYWDGTKTK